ncbi:unnamed protein product [Caenorhabditis bovis]|uniref:Cytochrome P450 n=1 Tax=Caenorhabditis bovis TaxID=2654633 RepID=A0A8S1EKT4_9PELO|nr:unnamed protein product [Caenorhabditis bovis]
MAFIVVTTVFVAFISYLIYLLNQRRLFFKIRDEMGIGGPSPHFLIGNLKQIIERKKQIGYDDSYQFMAGLHEIYGKYVGIYLGRHLNIHVTDEDDIKEIYIKNFSNFSDRVVPPIFEQSKLISSLLQASYADGWKRIRSAIAPTFSTGKMRAMHHAVESKIDTFLKLIEEKVDSGEKFDIYDDYQALTLDVIGKCAFAIESNSLNNREEVFYVQARKFILHTDIRHSVLITSSFVFPEFTSIWKMFYRFSQLALSQAPLVGGLENVYERRKNGEGRGCVDLLELLIERENSVKDAMSKEEVIQNCFAFLLAGYETTSTALAFCTYLLAEHQQVQQKLYDEIQEVKAEQGFDYDSIHGMKYLDAVFKESLRVYPPVIHFITRVCLNDITINGQFFPKGTNVSVLPYNVHMNEKNWENAKKFIPERFLDWNDKGSLKWIPFGVGPRYCVGMRFAEMEFKTAIVRLLDRFKLELYPDEPKLVPACNGVIMRPKDPVRLRLTKRV